MNVLRYFFLGPCACNTLGTKSQSVFKSAEEEEDREDNDDSSSLFGKIF